MTEKKLETLMATRCGLAALVPALRQVAETVSTPLRRL